MNTPTKEELQANLDALVMEKDVLVAGNNLTAKKRALEDKRAMTALAQKDSDIAKLQAQIDTMTV